MEIITYSLDLFQQTNSSLRTSEQNIRILDEASLRIPEAGPIVIHCVDDAPPILPAPPPRTENAPLVCAIGPTGFPNNLT